jgi:hypothetical protein
MSSRISNNSRRIKVARQAASMEWSAKLDGASALSVKHALEKFPLAVQDRVMRRALWAYNKQIAKTVKAMRPTRSGALKRAMSVKMKNYKGVCWGSVAGRTGLPKDKPIPPSGKARRAIYDANAGWREHFAEIGYHIWPKGVKSGTKSPGRGWKRGKYHRGRGLYRRGSLALLTMAQVFQPRLLPILRNELYEAALRYAGRAVSTPKNIFARV